MEVQAGPRSATTQVQRVHVGSGGAVGVAITGRRPGIGPAGSSTFPGRLRLAHTARPAVEDDAELETAAARDEAVDGYPKAVRA